MNKFYNLFIFSLLIIISACNQNKVFQDYKELNESLWYKSDIIEFDVDIIDTGSYNITVALRYIEGCPHQTLPVKIQYTSPSGENITLDHEFIIFDEDGYFQGEIAGSICDLENTLEDKIDIKETGNYKFSIAQELNRDPAMLIMEIGLILEKNSQ